MKRKRAAKLLPLVLTLMMALPFLTSASSHLQATPTATEGEVWSGPVTGESADPGNALSLTSGSLIPTNPTLGDYLKLYNQATALRQVGVEFRSRDLQRLDPATCNPQNTTDCSFSVTGIQNNYLDFNDGRLYWRFCADYDEPYVGVGAVEQAIDDPNNDLQFDIYGYCPLWDDLTPDQKIRRVPDQNLDNSDIDIRNTMLDAQRIFAYLAVAQPANATFSGENFLDILTVNEAGALILGPDEQPDRVRDVGEFFLLQVTREIANVHLIFGNEFMVGALRFPFSTDGNDSEQLIRDEQKELERALHQYSLAIETLMYTLNYNLGGASDTYTADFFTDREFQLFAAASERAVTALTELAKRDRLLGTDSLAGDQAALARLEASMLEQYLQALALAGQSTMAVGDDPSTPDINEGRTFFMENGGQDIMNNIRQLVQQAQSIRAGLNPLGYEDAFVPLKPFADLLTLTCGGETVCTAGGGLLNSAAQAGDALADSQRTFDESFSELSAALSNLQTDFDTILTEICGQSNNDDNGDGLQDFAPCGFFDHNDNGRIDDPGETSGLMGSNYWDILAAEKELSLAARQVENQIERIRIEEERAGQVIDITLSTGDTLSAYQLAIGKLNAYRTTDSVATSSTAAFYTDLAVEATIGTQVTVEGSVNPLSCILGGCDASVESTIALALRSTIGVRSELALISTAETVWSPNDAIIGQFESLAALKEAERDAQIEGANSEATIRNLMLEQSELLEQVEIAQTQLNKAINEHNLLVDQYTLYLTQRAGTVSSIQDSYLSKPYFRLFRDSAALEAARTLNQAQQAAYLTAKAYEYYTLSPVTYLRELYQVRNPANLRAFLDKLASDYAPIPPEKFSKVSYRLSLAQDLLGLSDENLNPDGVLSPAEVEQLRFEQFQAILQESHYINTSTGFDRVVIPFSTDLNHPKFLKGVFNNRISRTSSADPGCTAGSGCRGVWLNLVTDQNQVDFQGDLPKITLSHGGQASYLNGLLQEVTYDPGPALMVGRVLPDGFGGNGREDALMTIHLNLPFGAEPDPNLLEDNFFNLSVATSQWSLTIDLTNSTNTILDLSQIRDIELRMDTTYVTPSPLKTLAEMDRLRVEAETAGRPIPEEAQAFLSQYEQEQAQARRDAQQSRPQSPVEAQEEGDQYAGSLFVETPVELGTIDTGFILTIEPDGSLSGSLCADCTPVYDAAVPLSGTYDAGGQTVAFQSDPFSHEISGQTVMRTIAFEGQVQENGDLIEGTYTETLTGYSARPIVSEGTFLVTRQSGANFLGQPQLLLQADPLSVPPNGSAALTVILSDASGQPMSGRQVTFSANLGSVSPADVTTDSNGVAVTTFTAGGAVGTATITAMADDLTAETTILISESAPLQWKVFLPLISNNP